MKKQLLIALFMLSITCESNAQITYHNITPDTTISTWNAFTISPSTVISNDIVIWWHPSPEVVVQTHGNCQVLFDAGTALPSKLELNDTITESGTWNAGSYDPLSSGGLGNWKTDATEKYLGFRFKNSTSLWYYGWLLMTVAPGASSFTVSEWAYNSAPGQSIKAGLADATSILSAKRQQIEIKTANGSIQFNGLQTGLSYPISISNTNGQTIHSASISANELMDISDYAKGIYIVTLSANGFIYNFKVPVL